MVPTLEMIKATGIDPKRVVIEITESQGDIEMLKDMVAVYHEAGLMVAVDDFGAGASQVDRVEALRPDIVKLDMRLFSRLHVGDIARILPCRLPILPTGSGVTLCAKG
jgi:EAL domain-containing protein (putative c-di-GMP-specific phosphodiesterase class I)